MSRAIDTSAVDTGPTAAAVRSTTALLAAIGRLATVPKPLVFVSTHGGYSLEWHHVDDRSLSVTVDNDGRFTVHRFGIDRLIDGSDEGAIWHEDLSADEVEQLASRIAALDLPHEKLQMPLGQVEEVPEL